MYSSGQGDYWWLRSPGGYSDDFAALVNNYGYLNRSGYNVAHNDVAVRPAFNLNLSSVLFTSAAEGADALTAVSTDSDVKDWKLTLKDSGKNNFSAEAIKIGETTYIAWSGAETGNNEYLSVLVCDSDGSGKYYGRLQNLNESGETFGRLALTSDFTNKIGEVDTM